MRVLTILLLIPMITLAGTKELDPVEKKDWSLIVKTYNGTISILKNLSLSEVEKAYDSLEDHSGPGLHGITGSEVIQRTIIGPDEWDGCKKAMHHQFQDAYELVKSRSYDPHDPNVGKYYHFRSCRLCRTSDPKTHGDYIEASQLPQGAWIITYP